MVAEDWEIARYACSLIKIEYNVLPVVFDLEAAMLPTSPLSGRGTTANFSAGSVTRPTTSSYPTGVYTDTAAFADATVTLQTAQPWSCTFQHNPCHPKTGLAYMIGDDIYGYASSQNGTAGRAPMATATGLPLHKCHVQIHGCGGGQGDGYTEPHTAIAGRHSKDLGGHAVTYKLSRQGHNHIGIRQYDTRSDYKIGAKADGTLVAWTGSGYGNGGTPGLYGLQKTFKIPWISVTNNTINPNTPGRGAWRCVSDPPGAWNYDIALDKLAIQLNMDPWDLRVKNLMPSDAPDQDTAVDTFGRPRYWSMQPKGINACFTAILADSGYMTKRHAANTKTLADGRMHGISITGHQDSHGGVSGATRYGHLRMGGQDNTGKCFAYVGGSKGSDGASAIMLHIAAEVLGLLYTDMALGESANSDINLDTGSQGGSAYTGGAGSGMYNAALLMRNKLFERAVTLAPFATLTGTGVTKATGTVTVTNGQVTFITVTNGGTGYSGPPTVTISGGGGAGATAIAQINSTGVVTGVVVTFPGTGYTNPVASGATAANPTIVTFSGLTPNDLDAKNSVIFLKSDPTKTITHATVSNGMIPFIAVAGGWASNFRSMPAGGLPGTGALQAKLGDSTMTTGACASVVEVAVDTDTGEVEVTGIWNYIHTGTSIFKQGCLKEIGSGAEEIIGQVLFFGDVLDPNTGAVLQMAHGEFHQPTSLDYNPASFHLLDVQTDDVAAPCGGRGIGEPCLSNIGSVVNAVYNAIGKWVDPEHGAMTPDKVLKALGKA